MSPFHTSLLVVSVFTDTFSLVSVFWTRFFSCLEKYLYISLLFLFSPLFSLFFVFCFLFPLLSGFSCARALRVRVLFPVLWVIGGKLSLGGLYAS